MCELSQLVVKNVREVTVPVTTVARHSIPTSWAQRYSLAFAVYQPTSHGC